MANTMKFSTLAYLIVGIICVFIVGVVATAYYGSGGLYILLFVFGGLGSYFFISVFSISLQSSVSEEFGEKTVGQVVEDVGFDIEYQWKRLRDKIFFKD